MGIIENYDMAFCYGKIRYFKGARLYNEKSLYDFNKGKIKAKELVSFDTSLMDLTEITQDKIDEERELSEQIMAVIVRPEIEPNYFLESKGEFEFCGYDLVDCTTGISAIINCGAEWGTALDYSQLNEYGLFSNYRQAVLSQLDLVEQFPDESHAYCDVVEIWRSVGKIQ